MTFIRSSLARLRDLFRRDRLEQRLDEDLRFHREELEELYRNRGYEPEAARQAAVRELGNTTRIREDFHEQAGFPLAEELLRDIGLAWRSLRKRPAFSLGVLAILGLALGLSTLVQGMADAIFLRSLPVYHPEELAIVLNPDGFPSRLSRGTADRIAAELGSGHVAAYSGITGLVVRHDGLAARHVTSQLVNGSFFPTLGLGASAGRLLVPDDERRDNSTSVAVISHAWAKAEFGGASQALGRDLLVNKVHVTIVGVLPENFGGLSIGQRVDLWMPASLQSSLAYSANCNMVSSSDRPNNPDWNREERVSWMNVLLRAPRNTRLAELTTLVAQAHRIQGEDTALALGDPGEKEQALHRSFVVKSAPGGYSYFRENYRSTSRLLTTFVSVLLVLAGANVSGLLLVRNLSRQGEIGVRVALGAKRWRIYFLLCAEALLLSLGAAILGLFLANSLLPVALSLVAPGQVLMEASLNWRLFGTTTALAGIVALVASFFPALFLVGLQPQEAISCRGIRTRSSMLVGRGLVAFQLALAVVLIGLSISLAQELARALASDPGFARTEVLTCDFNPQSAGYKAGDTETLRLRLEEALRRVPGIASVSFSQDGLVSGSFSSSGLYPRGSGIRESRGNYQQNSITPGFFKTTGMVLLGGRDFLPSDGPDTQHVAIVSRSFAQKVFGEDNPVGRQFGFGPTASNEDITIVGVVADARMNGLRDVPPAVFFLPLVQWQRMLPLGSITVRLDRAPTNIRTQLQKIISEIEPGIVYSNWSTFEERLAGGIAGEKTSYRLVAIFAGSALLLAATGLSALGAYLVTQRSREFAVRLAVGAQPGTILRSVMKESAWLGLIGIVPGMGVAWALQSIPALASRLPSSLAASSSLLAAIVCLVASVLACWGPARRASRINPLQLLRSD
jgi:predicted permease